jgi:hypothetical protein
MVFAQEDPVDFIHPPSEIPMEDTLVTIKDSEDEVHDLCVRGILLDPLVTEGHPHGGSGLTTTNEVIHEKCGLNAKLKGVHCYNLVGYYSVHVLGSELTHEVVEALIKLLAEGTLKLPLEGMESDEHEPKGLL